MLDRSTLDQHGKLMSTSSNPNHRKFIGLGMCFGVAIGCGIGVAIGNLAMGIGPGIGIGIGFGALLSKWRR
ncbi:MAG: glycine zipper family protein [Lysobacteraceae bacterium]|nr:MAG: glycine zipper family protein [Xanthomonadaceae bacterium]